MAAEAAGGARCIDALLPTGLKETLVLKGPQAPAAFVFRVAPAAGKALELVARATADSMCAPPGARCRRP